MRAPQYLPGFSPAPLGFMVPRVPTSLILWAGPSKLPKEWIKHPLCFFIVLALPVTSSWTLSRLLHLSGPQIPHLKMRELS